jgi:hypothetical protein
MRDARCEMRDARCTHIVATGFMPGISVGGDAIAGSTRSLGIELRCAVHSLHLHFFRTIDPLRTSWRQVPGSSQSGLDRCVSSQAHGL